MGAFLLLIAFVSACSPLPPQNTGAVSRSGNHTIEELRRIARENSSNDMEGVEFTAVQQINTQYKGTNLNTKTLLFSEKIRNENDRFERLENVVQDIHKDIHLAMPAIKRLAAIEGDIRELHSKLIVMVERQNSFVNPISPLSENPGYGKSNPDEVKISKMEEYSPPLILVDNAAREAEGKNIIPKSSLEWQFLGLQN